MTKSLPKDVNSLFSEFFLSLRGNESIKFKEGYNSAVSIPNSNDISGNLYSIALRVVNHISLIHKKSDSGLAADSKIIINLYHDLGRDIAFFYSYFVSYPRQCIILVGMRGDISKIILSALDSILSLKGMNNKLIALALSELDLDKLESKLVSLKNPEKTIRSLESSNPEVLIEMNALLEGRDLLLKRIK